MTRTRNTSENVSMAVQKQNGIRDRNLPVYISNYNLTAPVQHDERVDMQWSSACFLPSLTDRKRNLNLKICSVINHPPGVTGGQQEMSFLFDFSTIGDAFASQFQVSLEGPVEGYISYGDIATTLSATDLVDYVYDASTYKLTLHMMSLPVMDVQPVSNMFIDVTIQDDIDDPTYPIYFPYDISLQILRIPRLPDQRGLGIRIVLPLLVCCPEEILSLTFSSFNTNIEGAFNPLPEIEYLMELQGQPQGPVPDIKYIPDSEYDIPDNTQPVDWKTNEPMLDMCGQLQILFSTVPRCTAIVLFGTLKDHNSDAPAYMKWLRDNMNQYDIVCAADYQYARRPYSETEFRAIKDAYDEIHEILYENGKPFLCPSGRSGQNVLITSPSNLYNFNVANRRTLTFGAFELTGPAYMTNGNFTANKLSNGGFCNTVFKPQFQHGIVAGSLYGSPDFAGYVGQYRLSINVGSVVKVASGDYAHIAYAGLFAMIYGIDFKMDWKFLEIIYKKSLTFTKYIAKGDNVGTSTQNRYMAKNYMFWNPISGTGVLDGSFLLASCETIRAQSYVQISLAGASMCNLSFLNIMPRNPFADLQRRQPVFGCSSIFSIFKVLNVNAPNSMDILRTTSLVHFVDVTERYALSYGYDDDQKYFITVDVFRESSSQMWYLLDYDDASKVRPIFAYDGIQIAPFESSVLAMTSTWNAMGAEVPGSPSIASNPEQRDAFCLSSDPAWLGSIDAIKTNILDDITTNSYYVNFTNPAAVTDDPMGTNPQKDIVYLKNPYLLRMDDNDELIHNARNELYTSSKRLKWEKTGFSFDELPQWVLVPVPSVIYNPLNTSYQQALLNGGQFMIFNSVMQSYACVSRTPDGSPEIILKPITSAMKIDFPFSDFVFTVYGTTNPSGPIESVSGLFEDTVPLLPVGYPVGIPYGGFSSVLSIFNRSQSSTVQNGWTRFYTWDRPNIPSNQMSADLTVVETNGQYNVGSLVGLFWVFKKFIANLGDSYRLISSFFIDGDTPPPLENIGKGISLTGGNGNANNHAPSMLTYNVTFNSMRWKFKSNRTTRDLNNSGDGAVYIYLDENITADAVTATELQIVSIQRSPATLSELAITVFGARPQPIITTLPFSTFPDAVRWNVSSNNAFFSTPYTPGGVPRRVNYFYTNRLYSFFTLNPFNASSNKEGFLSSQFADGCAPSISAGSIVPQSASGRYYKGSNATTFALIP